MTISDKTANNIFGFLIQRSICVFLLSKHLQCIDTSLHPFLGFLKKWIFPTLMNRLSLLSRESGRLGLDPAEQRFRPSGLSEQSITAATISAQYYRLVRSQASTVCYQLTSTAAKTSTAKATPARTARATAKWLRGRPLQASATKLQLVRLLCCIF